jgi:hypothetical protein
MHRDAQNKAVTALGNSRELGKPYPSIPSEALIGGPAPSVAGIVLNISKQYTVT